MHPTSSYLAGALIVLAAALSAGCGDSSAPASQLAGTIAITVATTSAGGPIDPDGYSLSVDNGPGQVIPVDADISVTGRPIGKHLVRLDGVAANCTVDGDNPLSVQVTIGMSATPARFLVMCWPYSGPSPWDY